VQRRVSHTLSGHARRGTLPYMAPELVSDPDHVSEKADVWSLGMVLWEMLCLETPFQTLTPQQIIAGLMVGNLAPEARPHSLPQGFMLSFLGTCISSVCTTPSRSLICCHAHDVRMPCSGLCVV